MKIPLGEWLPDQPGVTGAITDAKNCYPVTNGYAPFPSEADYSDAAAQDLLITFAGKYAGATNLFAAGATQVYKFDSADASLDALTTTGYTAVESWDATQFGAKMILANGQNKLQAYEIGVSTYFADLAAAAPTAKFVTVVRDFVVAANDGSDTNKVYWSDINDETDWTPGAASQSDIQIIPDGGDITGLAGGEYGLIFLERAIYRMSYSGSPFFFQFDAISRSLGCLAPGSITQFGGITYFLADDGFYSCNGQGFTTIGEEKVNRWFFDRVTRQDIRLKVSATVDPIRKLALWCFPLQSGGYGILVYNIPLGKWSYLDTTATSVASALSATVTLEQLDNFSSSIDALQVSLDDPQWAGNQLILIGTSGQRVITFGNANKTAYVVSGDINQGRSTITLAKPIVDGGSAEVSIASRTLLSDQILFGTAVAADSENRASLRANGNYHRVKVTPTGDNWETVVGTDIEITKQGNR
jgi:hypothetical protein